MLKYKYVEIRRSELHASRVLVPEWEVALLMAIWEGQPSAGGAVGQASVVDEKLVNREPPDPEEEYRRLAKVYRSPSVESETGTPGLPYVAQVYGQFGIGTANLARAIRAAVVDETSIEDLLGLAI